MSGESQGGVRTDINSDLVLSVWRDITGLEYKPGNAFHDMVKDWQRAGATVQNVSDAIAQVNGQANTPMYLRNIVLSLHDNEPEAQSQKNLEKFRQLYREQKQAGGDNGIHE
jgi:hypothetical protein